MYQKCLSIETKQNHSNEPTQRNLVYVPKKKKKIKELDVPKNVQHWNSTKKIQKIKEPDIPKNCLYI